MPDAGTIGWAFLNVQKVDVLNVVNVDEINGEQDIQLVKGFPDELRRCVGFEWDAGNADRNWGLHQVARGEAECLLFNRPFIVAPDSAHSQGEPHYAALGRTDQRRPLTVVFTVRGSLVRVISARGMSRRERRIYDQASRKE